MLNAVRASGGKRGSSWVCAIGALSVLALGVACGRIRYDPLSDGALADRADVTTDPANDLPATGDAADTTPDADAADTTPDADAADTTPDADAADTPVPGDVIDGGDIVVAMDAIDVTDVPIALDAMDAADVVDAADVSDAPCAVGMHVCAAMCVLDTDPAACGATCIVCPAVANATPTCTAGACGFTCSPGFAVIAGACVRPPPPRPISPSGGSAVTSITPTFRWVLAPGTDGAVLQVCSDRACTAIVQTVTVTGGATSATLPSGLAFRTPVYFWRLLGRVGTTAGTTPSPTWQLLSRYRSPASGVDLWFGAMLDANGDHFADVAVGAPTANTVTLFHGSATGASMTPSATLTGAGSFGSAVAPAGDVDGDGFTDLIVGAPGSNAAFVYRGSATGIVSAGPTMLSSGGGMFGTSVAAAGDVNGDGYADVIVGAPGTNNAFVYHGSATGLSTIAATTLSAAGGQFGRAVTGASNFNNDFFSDIAVGAPGSNNAFVYYGSATGLPTTASATITGAAASTLGSSISGGVDVMFTGYSSLVVGAPGARTAFVYLGSAAGIATTAAYTLPQAALANFGVAVAGVWDIDNNGYDDIVVGSTANSGYVYLSNSAGPGARMGFTLAWPPPAGALRYSESLSGTGPIDGDEYGDFVVGAPGSGQVEVNYGCAAGVCTYPVITGPAGSGFGTAVAVRRRARDIPIAWCPVSRPRG